MENTPTLTFAQLVAVINTLSKEEKEKLKQVCFTENVTVDDPIKDFVLASFQEFETVYKALVK